MRRSFVAAVAVGAVAAATPAAVAHPHFDYSGGCFLLAANDESPTAARGGREAWYGYLGSATVARRSDGVRPAPTAPITVDCTVYNNGTLVGTAFSFAGTGVALGASPYVYVADVDDVLSVCAEVTVVGEAHPPKCTDVPVAPVVPGPVAEVLGRAQGAGEAAVCPVFGVLSPGVPGVLEVSPDGDVTVPPVKVYDCPPKDDPPPPNPAGTMFAFVIQ